MGGACSSPAGSSRVTPAVAPSPAPASPLIVSAPPVSPGRAGAGAGAGVPARAVLDALRGIEDADSVSEVVARLTSAVALILESEAATCYLLDPAANYVGVRVVGNAAAHAAFDGLRVPPGIGVGARLTTATEPIAIEDMRA
jgi:hypothetical protein